MHLNNDLSNFPPVAGMENTSSMDPVHDLSPKAKVDHMFENATVEKGDTIGILAIAISLGVCPLDGLLALL